MTSGTNTSDFGSSKRENHDSSYFYASKLYTEIEPASSKPSNGFENKLPPSLLNKIVVGDSRDLSKIPDISIHLVVTSPPYNSRKQYDDDLSLSEYLSLIEDVFRELYDKIVDGGRVCINIANMGRKPYVPLSDYISQIMMNLGYIQRGEVIWDKAASAGSSTAWGSWQSSTNPILRDVHEYILIFSKGTMKRVKAGKTDTISKDEFLEYTKSIWQFQTESAKKIGHPAPFPVELPYRCIQLLSLKDDVVFDPFMGSGTTAIAAMETYRNYLGFDLNEKYVELANDRVDQWHLMKEHADKF